MSIELKYSYKVNITLVKPIVIKKKFSLLKLFVRVELILAEANLIDAANLLFFSNSQPSVGTGD